MRLGEIDLSLKPLETKLYLCKPNTSVISPLKDVGDVSITDKLGEVGELSFTIPVKIERNRELIDNPLIDKIKSRYLVKAVFNQQTEYYILLEDNKTYDDSGEKISYKAFGRGYALADKVVKSFLEESKTLSEIGSALLVNTNWKIGYVDSYFDLLYRTFEAPSQTVLEALYDLAEKFKAVIVWDTVKLTVNFHQPSKMGANRGLRFKEGKYLESFDAGSSTREVVTRLRVYGAEGLTFRNLTPTGVNYLEDFSWFMYPFERDKDGNVVRESYYMSNELCIALENYTKVLAESQGEFDRLLEELLAKQNEIQTEEQVLTGIKAQLAQVVDSLDVSNSSGGSGTEEHAALLEDKSTLDTKIAKQQASIDSLNNDRKAIEKNMDDLRILINIETHLPRELLLELNDFIIEKEFFNESIIYAEDLLEEGIKEFNRLREPSVNINMGIVNFLSVVEAQNDWNKLRLGDVVEIESKQLRIGIELRIIEIVYDIENNSISLRVANEADLKDDYDRMLDEIYNASSTSTVVNMDRYKWNMAEDAKDGISQILNNKWDATKQGIQAGYNQMLDITERGIFVRSPQDPKNLLVLQNGVLGLSNNGGDDWNLAVTPDGVFAERLVGRILMGNKLVIEDEEGIIQLTGSKQEIYDKDKNVKVTLGEYERGKYGMKIDSGALEIVGGITSKHINPDLYEELSYDDTDLRSSLRLTSPLPNSISLNSAGITAYTDNTTNFARLDYRGLYVQGGAVDIRTSSSSSRGIVFDNAGISSYNSSGTRTFHVDTNGNLTANNGSFGGRLNGATGTFSGDLSAAGGTFRGDLSAATGTFSGTLSGGTVSGSLINGGSINIGNGNFTVNSSGHMTANSGTFRGSLDGASGTFSGNITTSRLTIGSASPSVNETGNVIALKMPIRITNGVYVWGEPTEINLYNGTLAFKGQGDLLVDSSATIWGDLHVRGNHNIVAKFG